MHELQNMQGQTKKLWSGALDSGIFERSEIFFSIAVKYHLVGQSAESLLLLSRGDTTLDEAGDRARFDAWKVRPLEAS